MITIAPPCECAPLEGVTGPLFRRLQSRYFQPAERYYTPFLSPTSVHRFTAREKRELLPENNCGLNVIPQLIGHNAEDFLWAAGEIQSMGYKEINLNLGCPSGTVVAKKKGAGLLSETELLTSFLDGIYEKSPLPISIKTRIGRRSPEEFPALLELFNRYPVKLLILHPRIQTQQYKGLPDREMWNYALTHSKNPLCYNGDIFSAADARELMECYPETPRLMLGRGLVCNPNLIAELNGGEPLKKEALIEFHSNYYAELKQTLPQDQAVLLRMKEMWGYWGRCFADAQKPLKKLFKAQSTSEFDVWAAQIFACNLRSPAAFFSGPIY